jgi:inosine/xanthosine triphosphatase
MKIAVGSENPTKIEAVKNAFTIVWPEESWDVTGHNVGSDISDQPMSDEESIQGAKNRARKALELTKADFGVGLEGGLQQIGEYWFDSGWIVVVNKEMRESAAQLKCKLHQK